MPAFTSFAIAAGLGLAGATVVQGQNAAKDAKKKANSARDAEEKALKDSALKASKSRASLFATSGGVVGQELTDGGVTQRNSLLGN